MKRILQTFLFFLFFSCSVVEEQKEFMAVAEFPFPENLISLSPHTSSDKLWIGTKGDVILFDEKKGREVRRFNFAPNFIYKVDSFEQLGDTILFVGVQDRGLQRWKINGTSYSNRRLKI